MEEFDIYGSSRLGILNKEVIVAYRVGVYTGGTFIPGIPDTYTIAGPLDFELANEQVGYKNYELTNHLGNVLATITDRKVPNIVSNAFTYFNAQIVSMTDYYPFGMQIEERSWTAPSNKYRFGFQGQEKENDISGNDGDHLAFTYRIHDARLGRFLSVDPLEKEYPWNSPYAFSENRVISAIELEGLEAHDLNNGETAYGPYAPGVIDGVNKGYSSGYFSLEIPFSEAKNEIINKTSAFSQEEPSQGSLVTGIREPWGVRQCINCPKGPIPSIDPITNEVSGTIEMSMGLWEDGTSFLGAEVGVGKPSIGESMIPIWGSGRSAISDFQNGRYVSGTFNSVMAVSDVFLVKSVATSVGKGAWKAGSNSWRATRSWYGKTRNLPKGSQVHHWLIHNNGTIGKNVPNYIKNQPWNFKVFSNQSTHFRYGHGWSYKGQQGANAIGRLWYGTPTWTKALTLSYGGRGVGLTLGTLGD